MSNKGTHWSLQSRQRFSEIAKLRIRSKETRDKTGETLKAYYASPEGLVSRKRKSEERKRYKHPI
jgi:hypothetical protein